MTPHSQHGAPASSQRRFSCPRMSEMCVDSIKSGLGMGHTGPRAAPQARAGCGGPIGVALPPLPAPPWASGRAASADAKCLSVELMFESVS